MQHQPSVTRRNFLTHATAFGVAGLVGGGSLGLFGRDRATAQRQVRLDELTAADFSAHLGDTFHLQSEGRRPREAVLVKIQQSPARPNQARQAFSVQFRLTGTDRMPHQICQVEHAQMGSFDLFLGAVGLPASDVTLEAVFS